MEKEWKKELILFFKEWEWELTPLDFRNPRVCSVDFGKILIFFDDCLSLTQRPLEPKGRRPKPHWSGAGAVSSFGPIFI